MNKKEPPLTIGSTEPFPWLCSRCGQPEVWPTIITYQSKMKYEGRSYEFEVPDLEAFNNEADRKISAAFRAELENENS